MSQLETDWRALIGSVCWGWILCFIPTVIKAVQIATTHYTFDGTYFLTQQTGLISRKTAHIDLRRAKMINASDSPFQGGSLSIVENNGYAYELPYVKNANAIAQWLRSTAEASSRQAGDMMQVVIS
ncbi:MAG: PH domain-containing protein [Bifidobacteriales bacterium]|nr:PH domain-containing protein [Bifidobacteriales bacterium]